MCHHLPPFGAAGNPVDITGGEPPTTYQNTVRLGLEDDRIHALILGYWHTIVTPPMVFARNMVEVKKEMEAKGFVKPIVASLAGDVEVEGADLVGRHLDHVVGPREPRCPAAVAVGTAGADGQDELMAGVRQRPQVGAVLVPGQDA